MVLKYRTGIFLLSVVMWLSAPSWCKAADIPDTPGNHVVDLAGIVSDDVENQLNRYLTELEQKTTAQVAVLTVDSLDGQSIEDFSINIAHNKWKLGQKGKDNGVLLLVAVQDRKYRIEVGYGLEGILPDSLVGSIGRQFLVPYFKRGDYSTGIYSATVAIANIIAKDAGVQITGLPALDHAATQKQPGGSWLKFLFLPIFLLVVFGILRNPRGLIWYLLASSMSGGGGRWGGPGGGFGGLGGGGGFGGGGGGFGGGGASGSW
jgi:uncharacterized protein